MRATKKNDTLELEIYGVVGEEITAPALAKALDDAGDVSSIVVRINSPGGSVWDGSAIYSRLVDHPAPVTTIVDGIALSAASFIVQAGDVRKMAEAGTAMLHNAWSVVVGDRQDLAKAIEMLGKFDATLASIYAARSGQTVSAIASMMNAETWLTAAEALEAGFVDEVLPLKTAENLWDLSCYSRVPRGVKNGSRTWQPSAARARDLSFTLPTLSVSAMATTSPKKGQTMTTTPSTLTAALAGYRREFVSGGGKNKMGVSLRDYLHLRAVDDGFLRLTDDLPPGIYDEPENTAADARFLAEWAAQGGEKTGLSEADFIAMRRVDEGLDRLM